MYVGEEIIGTVKTNTKGFFKETVENLANDWLGGSYLMLKRNPMVPGNRLLIYID